MKIVPQASRLIRKYGLFYFDFCVSYKFRKESYFIEVDGGYHKRIDQAKRDRLKEEAIKHISGPCYLLRIFNEECSDTDKLSSKMAKYLLG